MKYRSEQRGALLDGRDPEFGMKITPICVDGVLHIPADFFAIGTVPQPDKSERACALIRLGGMGMAIGLTPATMRKYAATLIQIAEEQKAKAAAATQTALKKAAGQ